VVELTNNNNDLLVDYITHLNELLSKIGNEQPKLAESFRSIYNRLNKNTEDMLWRLEKSDQEPPSNVIFTAIKHLYWTVKKTTSGWIWGGAN